MSARKFEENILPHLIHVAIGSALICLSVKILRRFNNVSEGLRKIEDGHRQIVEGRREIFSHKK